VGIYSAMIGVLAVGTGELVGGYGSVASVLLLAFIFGYGQQALTTFIDRKVASTVKDKAS
jgi:ribose/xylose/arabinose/galactoside ABC-type transport system permease subunit